MPKQITYGDIPLVMIPKTLRDLNLIDKDMYYTLVNMTGIEKLLRVRELLGVLDIRWAETNVGKFHMVIEKQLEYKSIW